MSAALLRICMMMARTVIPATPSVEYLVVAGGGGCANQAPYGSAGAGAGGFRTATGYAVTAGAAIAVTVGAGGVGGQKGANSVFGTITSLGGGFGGAGGPSSGGSGSGDCGNGGAGGGTAGQGNRGGYAYDDGSIFQGGGGGGAGGVGGDASGASTALGGPGLNSSISGSSVGYAGGGSVSYASVGYGGGAGNGNGSANTGGGAGGYNAGTGSPSGGSGIVILRYPDTYPAATSVTGSPTITVTGGYRIYKWTAVGTWSITF